MKSKIVTTILLMSTIIGISIFNFIHLSQTPPNETLTSSTKINTYFNENFVDKYSFINLYGGFQKLMGKNEVDNFDIVRDEQGKLHFQYFAKGPNDMSEIVKEMRDFNQHLSQYNMNLAFILPPDKVIRGYTTFSEGLPYNYANEGADHFLSELSNLNIASLDLRKGILESGIPASQLFFDTDHHWTPQAAFFGFTQVVSFLNETFDAKIDPIYTQADQYETVTYSNFFLGSQGRRTGDIYAGLDDFTVIKPVFDTFLTYEWNGRIDQGRFDETVLQTYWLSEDLGIETDRYLAYLSGNYGEVTITNHLNEEGLKVLMIKDSFMLPLAAFLSTAVNEVKMIDLRYYEGPDMYRFVQTYQPDVVLVSASPVDLVPEFFDFYGGE